MKIKDGICGFIVGDALGVPVEFKSRETLENNPVVDMREYGTYHQPRGTWSDDSSMTIATMRSIVKKNGIDLNDIADEFCNWINNAKYTQYNEVFDSGITTSQALRRYERSHDVFTCGGNGERDNGNGSLMRVLPLAYLPDIDYESIENISAITHAHERSKIACVLYVEIAKSMLENDLPINEHVKNSCDKIKEHYKDSAELQHFNNIFNEDFTNISGKGYVISTFEAVIYCLETTTNYKDAVLKAVNLGNDTDTVAAICGGLAGIFYGYDAIPIDWIKSIPKLDRVMSLCEEFEALYDKC